MAFLGGFWGEKFWAQWYVLGKGNSGIYDTLWGTKTEMTGRQEKVRKSLLLRLRLRLLVSCDSKYSADPKSMLQDVLLVLFFFPLCPNIAKARRTNNNF